MRKGETRRKDGHCRKSSTGSSSCSGRSRAQQLSRPNCTDRECNLPFLKAMCKTRTHRRRRDRKRGEGWKEREVQRCRGEEEEEKQKSEEGGGWEEKSAASACVSGPSRVSGQC